MSDTGNGSNFDNKPQQEDVNLEEVSEVENKPVTPVKRTPSKRLSAVERAQRESEELVKTLGGSLDIEGGRKTRSSTRGTPSKSSVVHTPPPTKRARGTATPKRGRGRKLETSIEPEIKESPEKPPSEPEVAENSTVDATKTADEKPEEENKSETLVTATSEAVEEKSSAENDDKPEPMEVDGIGKDIETTESEKPAAEESVQKDESKPSADEVEKSDKVNDESEDAAKSTEKVADSTLPTDAEEKQHATLADKTIDPEVKPAAHETHENNLDAANDLKLNSNSSLTDEVMLPTETPAKPVPATGNEHKAENNELCEPKIVSPPLTANNEGATPQYCN